MRSDTNLNKRFLEEGVDASQYASMPGVLDTRKKVDGKPVIRSHSFSGNESNSVFLNHGGESFENISGLSGLGSLADGRAFAFLDFDHDGKSDIVLTNTNNPQLQLFHNRIQDAGNSINIRLVGGNRGGAPDKTWSSRDAYGAHVLVEVAGKTIRRELRGGDGFAAQNSDTLTIGIGKSTVVDKVSVIWPSGKKSVMEKIETESLVTIFENPGEAVPKMIRQIAASVPKTKTRLLSRGRLDLLVKKKLNVVVTLATWCPVCLGEVSHLRRLSERVGEDVGFYAFPIDPDDDGAKLTKFQKKTNPPYEILSDSGAVQREAVEKLMIEKFGEMPLPSTFILDDQGRVLKALKGTPTLSQLRLLSQ
ncbi:MAG: ASPIC/UnbV domain-containing protein [Akkermansiaceae bacterium]|nr:ASPIC/UnbV domain-containing protein [Akkermansiaceae bacterium]